MDETILCPSPNWFLPSILKVSEDGCLVYGGPGRSLILLEPISPELGGVLSSTHRYRTHVVHKCSKDRVVSVDISPEWPGKRHFVTGSADGAVIEWTVTQNDGKWSIKSIDSHDEHANEKEEVVAVGYSMATHIVSVGNLSRVVVWELNTNTTKIYSNFLRHFKPTCMSCSPHCPLVVAVGSKQGIVFVLDLNGRGNIVYKVRGQDDEISQVSWCPQYEVTIKRSFEEKKSVATQRLEAIRNQVDPSELDVSGADKELPEDSFNESVIVPEDDMFDIYKDHEANEFGHKKYQPEDIVVKEKVDHEKDDFLAECERLKAQILKNKQQDEESIETLVEAMDKAHVDEPVEEATSITGVASLVASSSKLLQNDGTDHIHRHLLASICKKGHSVRIWSKTGKFVASCSVAVIGKNFNKTQTFTPSSASLHWYSPETLLIVDGKTHLFSCNPLMLDCRNRLHWSLLHSQHRRGLYYVTSNAPRVQTSPPGVGCSIWTVGQDRNLIKYDWETRAVSAKYGTCGGFLYNITVCPYDAYKFAVGVGDGAVRIWQTQATGEEDNKLTLGEVTNYWQHVQGKILQCAWHPTKENYLAFSTAESRVGLLDISRGERPAKVLQTALTNGVYSIAWGEGMALFAVGGKELVMYQANKPDQAPIPIHLEIEGQKWEPTTVQYSSHGLTVGSMTGGVAVFSGPGGRALAAKFVFNYMIHTVQWHPQHTSNSDEESQYKDLLAVTALDKTNILVILRFEDREGGGKQLSNFNTLAGHTDRVLQAYWSPHREGQILSSSMDSTIRVWDAINGTCISVFDGHSGGTLGASWCALPQLQDQVISGGNDFCLRLWDINHYPADKYKVPEVKKEPKKKKKKTKATSEKVEDVDKKSDEEKEKEQGDTKENKEKNQVIKEDEQSDEDITEEGFVRVAKPNNGKRFMLPILTRQLANLRHDNRSKLLLSVYHKMNKEVQNTPEATNEADPELYDVDFLKLFGNINQVNEVLDMECDYHLERKAYMEYMMVMIFRGRIDSVIQFANEHDLLDPFLVSIAPCVSFKYWKDVMQLYVAQIDRLAVKKNEDSSNPIQYVREYPLVFRKAVALLSIHDVKGAVDVLEKANFYKEAYMLCRCRHMDSIAAETLDKWAWQAGFVGHLVFGAFLYIVQGKISNAATLLRRSKNQDVLNCAAELAKVAGLNAFADYMETKAKNTEKEPTSEEQTEELLEELPTRMELLMSEIKDQNNASKDDDLQPPDKVEVTGKPKVLPDALKNMSTKIELAKESTVQNGESNVVFKNGDKESLNGETLTETKE